MTKAYILGLVTLTLVACSTEEKVEPAKKVYSQTTENYFNIIERGGTYAPSDRNYNQQQPKTNTVNRAQRTRDSRIKKELDSVVINDQILTEERHAPVAKRVLEEKKVQNPQSKLNQNNDFVIEMNQLAAYFCMQNRNSPRFNQNEKTCNDFTDKQIATCLKKNPRPNAGLIKCVKTNLK